MSLQTEQGGVAGWLDSQTTDKLYEFGKSVDYSKLKKLGE